MTILLEKFKNIKNNFLNNNIYLNMIISFIIFLLLHLVYRNFELPRYLIFTSTLVFCIYLIKNKTLQPGYYILDKISFRRINYFIAAFVFFHLVFLFARLNQGHVADIGDTTLQSVQLLFNGKNPYESEIDTVALSYMGPGYGGFKYLPVMTIVYAPLCLLFDYRGIQITNFILNGLIAYLIYDIVKRNNHEKIYAKLASILYLSPFLIFSLLYAKGVNDLAPVFFILLAFRLRENYSFYSGLTLGLSISSKLLPGLILIPILFQGAKKTKYLIGGLFGALPIFIVALPSTDAFVKNIILFNFLRPISGNSWYLYFSGDVVDVLKMIIIASILSILIINIIRQQEMRNRLIYSVIVLILLILLSSGTPQNYNLWWIPLLISGVAMVPQKIINFDIKNPK